MIAIIDYGMGNLRSVQKGFEQTGYQAELTRDPLRIASANGIVLPGVGAFHTCMENLRRFSLIDPLRETLHNKKPFLGICLGYQVLFNESEEFGHQEGLGIFPGRVVGFRIKNGLKIPHMGWNRIDKIKRCRFLEGIPDGDYVYFVHSYYVVPEDSSLTATQTTYGHNFASSIATDYLFACQFHPEKSQRFGLQILANFGRFAEKG